MRTLFNTEIAHTIGNDLDTIIFSRHKDTRSLAPYKYRNRRDAIEQKLVGAMFEEEGLSFEQRVVGELQDLKLHTETLARYIHQVQPLVQTALSQLPHQLTPKPGDTKLTDWT